MNKIIKQYKSDIIVAIASLIVLIIGTLTIGFIIPFIIILIIDSIYFIPFCRKKVKTFIKNMKKRKRRKIDSKHAPAHAKKAYTKSYERENNMKKISNQKRVKNNKNGKKKKNKLLKILLLLFLGGVILVILGIVAFCIYIVSNAPDFKAEELYVTEPSIAYDRNGKEIAKLGSEKRVILTYDELPEVLIDAIVATEDSKFFSHHGVDWARFLKASAQQLLGHSNAGGASTLTMQVSKNTYTSAEASGIKGIIRKFTDVYISEFKIESHYSKEEILEFYVNSYYLGNNAYGVEQAALTYFGKSAKDLNLSEAAMIAGLFQAPSKYNPYTNPKATEKRRLLVLKLMKRHRYINDREYSIAKKMTVEKIIKDTKKAEDPSVSEYQSFIDVVAAEIEADTGDNPYTTPMKIYTTMDTDKQKYINDIMNGVSYEWENDQVQAGIAVTDVTNGELIAVGGGRNVNAIATLNHATQIKNQIGSTAKPLYDYGPAVEYLNWSSGTPDVDEPISYSDGTEINNWNGQFDGFETIRTALTRSRNIPALKAFQANNKENIKDFVSKLGLHPEEPMHEAHSIGGYTGESPQSMSAAYAAFANGGEYNSSHSYRKLEYMADDKTVEKNITTTQAMKDSTAYIVADMLVSTSSYAMGRYHNINGISYAAKTGTTNYDSKTLAKLGLTHTSAVNDLWVVGFNTEYSIGVWYGYDKNSSKYYNILSSGQHERLFQAVGRGMFTKGDNFVRPGSVSEITIESECPTPMLPSEFTPDSLKQKELFVKGSEPTETSERFAKLTDTTSVKATASGNNVTISWNSVSVPQISTESYLKTYFGKTFKNQSYLNSFVSSRLSYIKSSMGSFGYQVYMKKDSGASQYLGFTTNTTFSTNVSSSGNYTFIVKTSYSNFKSNASDGKSTNLNITVNGSTNNYTGNKTTDDYKETDENAPSPTCSTGYNYDSDKGLCVDSTTPDSTNTVTPNCEGNYKFDTNSKKCVKQQ